MLNFCFKITVLSVAFGTTTAFAAVPVMNLGSQSSSNCASAAHNDNFNDMRNLYTQVNVISKVGADGKLIKDPRKALKDLPSNIASDEIKQRVRVNTGYIFCFSSDPKVKPASGSGALFGDGGQLTTALHVLYDDDGKLYDRCEFRNQEAHAQRVSLDLSTSGLLPFTTDFNVHYDKDLVGVRLKSPILGAHPFRFDPTGRSMQMGDKVVVIAAHHDGQPKRFSLKEPIAELCTVRKTFSKTATAPTAVYSDCTSNGGGSGGIMFSIAANGEWIMGASVVGSGKTSQDYQPYSYEDHSVTAAVGLDPEIVARLQTFQDNKRVQIGINPAPNPQPVE